MAENNNWESFSLFERLEVKCIFAVKKYFQGKLSHCQNVQFSIPASQYYCEVAGSPGTAVFLCKIVISVSRSCHWDCGRGWSALHHKCSGTEWDTATAGTLPPVCHGSHWDCLARLCHCQHCGNMPLPLVLPPPPPHQEAQSNTTTIWSCLPLPATTCNSIFS